MSEFFFASDLHGRTDRYEKLFRAIGAALPAAVFLGGDLLPLSFTRSPGVCHGDFVRGFLLKELLGLRRVIKDAYPRVFLILGNDDPRIDQAAFLDSEAEGIWQDVHDKKVPFDGFSIYGYACVPPTPFHLKDWERYDVSRYVDPGCLSPEEGIRSVPLSEDEKRCATIQRDIARLAGSDDMSRAIFLFHAPPYRTALDLAALATKTIDHVPLDPHVGSIAIRRFIEERQPLLTLHGHIHESARLSSSWRDAIGRTACFSAAHDGPELALVRFDPGRLESATRELI